MGFLLINVVLGYAGRAGDEWQCFAAYDLVAGVVFREREYSAEHVAA